MGRVIGTQTQQMTMEKVAAKVTDGILGGSLITSLIFSNAKPWRFGKKYVHTFKYQKSSAMGWYTGMGNFNTTEQVGEVQGEWTPASMYGSVTMPGLELSVNKSLPIINQEAYKMESAGQDLLDSIGDAFYGSGAGNQCDGLDNVIDDGTVAATYAGLTRETYPVLNADVTSSVGSLLLDHIAASIDAATIGSHQPDLIITTKTLWRAIEDLLFPSITAQYGAAGSTRGKVNRLGDVGAGQTLTGLAGYTAIYFRGIPIVVDDKCPSGDIWYLNRDFIFWSGLPHYKYGSVSLGGGIIEGVDNTVPTNHGIAWTGFKTPINQDGVTGQFLLYGQLICTSPRHQAKDENCTA